MAGVGVRRYKQTPNTKPKSGGGKSWPNRRAQERERAAARAAEEAKCAEAKRQTIAEAQKIVAIWNARQAGGPEAKGHALASCDAHLSFSFVRRTKVRGIDLPDAKAAAHYGDQLAKGAVGTVRALDGREHRSSWYVHVTDGDGSTIGRLDVPE
jgi:hypothetical protein